MVSAYQICCLAVEDFLSFTVMKIDLQSASTGQPSLALCVVFSFHTTSILSDLGLVHSVSSSHSSGQPILSTFHLWISVIASR